MGIRSYCNERKPVRRTVVALAVVLGTSGVAAADDPPFTIGAKPAWALLGGVTTGGTVALADRGAFVGGEVSLARLSNANFVGLYADSYYDWGAHGTYVTGGFEAGHKLVGLDGGIALRRMNGETDVGITGRLTVGIGMVGIFGRYAYFTDVTDNEHVIQVGITLKLPLFTSGGT